MALIDKIIAINPNIEPLISPVIDVNNYYELLIIMRSFLECKGYYIALDHIFHKTEVEHVPIIRFGEKGKTLWWSTGFKYGTDALEAGVLKAIELYTRNTQNNETKRENMD